MPSATVVEPSPSGSPHVCALAGDTSSHGEKADCAESLEDPSVHASTRLGRGATHEVCSRFS